MRNIEEKDLPDILMESKEKFVCSTRVQWR